MKQFAVLIDSFKFDRNVGMFSDRVENTVREGEIARYEQFFLFLQCFPKSSTTGDVKTGLVCERVERGLKSFCDV